MNQLTIMGNLGADPEEHFTQSGKKVTTLNVADSRKRSGKDETIWWRVKIWGEHFDKIISYLKKGSSVVVTGEMAKPEIYSAKDGSQKISIDMNAYHVTFSPFKTQQKESEEEGGLGYPSKKITEHQEMQDEIPF